MSNPTALFSSGQPLSNLPEANRWQAGRGRFCRGLLPAAALWLGVWSGFAQSPCVEAQQISGLQAAQAMEQAMVAAIARAEKSVVAIARVRKPSRSQDETGSQWSGEPRDATGFSFSGLEPTDPDFVPNEFATGVVLDQAGHILTNYHVLGTPQENDYYVWVQRRPFRVTQVEVPEKVTAGDPWTDLAVLKINADDLQPIAFGNADALRKGMLVISLGNPYAIARDGQASASWGIIANLQRSASPRTGSVSRQARRDTLHHYGTLIQTDARLNLGTSGGALLNLEGEMIGLTTSLAALSGYEQSGGYAIPVDETFRRTIDVLKQGRQPAFGFLGVQPEHLSTGERQRGAQGASVYRVVSGSPADVAGLRRNDIVTHVNGTPIPDRNALLRELGRLPAGERVDLTVQRRNALRSGRSSKQLVAVLSKKYLESAGQGFAQVPDPIWRGMRVEYPWALPPDLSSGGLGIPGDQGAVAVLQVQRESPAWKAGLRPGQLITHVQQQPISQPKDFFAAVEGQSGDVQLRLINSDGPLRRTVSPELE